MPRYDSKEFCESMRLRLDYNYMMEDTMGDMGFTEGDFAEYHERLMRAGMATHDNREKMTWRELPYMPASVVDDIIDTADDIRAQFDAFVVLGIGGSALGPTAVQTALNHIHYNELPAEVRKGPRIYIEDNVDPEKINALFDIIDPAKTCFNVVTKSGSTSETMAQLLIVCDMLEKKLGGFKDNVIATTDRENGNLIKIAKKHGLKTFFVPDGVGGRFSELCPVGLLPAAVGGIDIKELLAGAEYMDELTKSDDYRENIAFMDGALQYISMERGINVSVFIPYSEGLKYMADWYAQLWAESLGKKYFRDGSEAFIGQTPVKALGVTDQHSQMQLYTEGPFDKVITFLKVEKFRSDIDIPGGFEDIPDVSFLSGHKLSDLLSAELQGTAYAMYRARRANKTIIMPEINAFTVGQLLYMLEVETAFVGELLDINAFDQPGVEESKQATYALMGKQGFDEKRVEMKNAPQPQDEFII